MFSGIIENFKRIWERAPFGDSIDTWQTSIPVDIGVIIYWIILLCGLLAISIWLSSNKKTSRLLDPISNNLLVVSSVIWLLGVIIYIVGFYREELNWLSVIPRAIISSFKMFVVTNELARVEPQLHDDAVYMSIFSLVHFTAAFITFLFICRCPFSLTPSSDIISSRLPYHCSISSSTSGVKPYGSTTTLLILSNDKSLARNRSSTCHIYSKYSAIFFFLSSLETIKTRLI